MPFLKDKKLIFILFIALLIRLVVFFIFQPWKPAVLQNDVFIYDAIGYNILAKCLAFNFSFCGDTFRTPVYPAFVAVFYRIFGEMPWIVILAQIILNVLSAWLLFKISRRLFSNKNIGYIAVLLFAFDPQQIIFTTYLYTDTLFVFLFLWSIYVFIKALQNENAITLLLAGLLTGITILTRPIAVYLPIAFFVFILLWNKFPFAKRIKCAVLFTAIAYFVLVPWMYRNYRSYDHFALSSINGYNLLFYNAAYSEVNRSHKTYDEVGLEFLQAAKNAAPEKLKPEMPLTMEDRLHGLTFEKSDVYNNIAKNYIRHHLLAVVKAHLAGSVKLHLNMGSEVIMERLHLPTRRWTDTEKYSGGIMTLAKRFFTTKTLPEILVGVFVLAFLFFIYATALIGLVRFSFIQKQWLWSIFIVLVIGYFAGLSGIFYTPRYRLPFMPFYMLLTGVFLTSIRKKKSN